MNEDVKIINDTIRIFEKELVNFEPNTDPYKHILKNMIELVELQEKMKA